MMERMLLRVPHSSRRPSIIVHAFLFFSSNHMHYYFLSFSRLICCGCMGCCSKNNKRLSSIATSQSRKALLAPNKIQRAEYYSPYNTKQKLTWLKELLRSKSYPPIRRETVVVVLRLRQRQRQPRVQRTLVTPT